MSIQEHEETRFLEVYKKIGLMVDVKQPSSGGQPSPAPSN